MNSSINQFKLSFFMIISSLFTITLLGFPYLINKYNNSSWYLPVIAIIYFLIITIPLKDIKINFFKNTKKNLLFKIIIIVYLITISLVLVVASSILLVYYFFPLYQIFIFIILTIIISLIVSYQNLPTIINTGLLFFFLVILIYLIPVFFFKNRDLSQILPLEFDIKILYLSFPILIFPMDNILFSLYSPYYLNGFKKKTFIITGIITLLFIILSFIDNISLIGAKYFLDLRFAGFYRWKLFIGNRFTEGMDIFLLYLICVSLIYRLGIYFNLIRIITLFKSKKRFTAIFGVLFIILCLLFYFITNKLTIITNILIYILIGIVFLIYIFIVLFSRRKQNE